jgi:CRP/FNR family transcriptional regulator, cyclic AMP receptor protein
MNQQITAQAQEKLMARLLSLGMPRQAASTLLERHMLLRYPKGAELFTKGSPADVVFAVISGVVKVVSVRPGSDRVLVELAGTGDLVGYADFADARGERSQLFGAQALTNSCVALFTRHHIAEVLKGLDADTLIKIASALNTMWSSVTYRYASFLGMSLRKRLEFVLNELAERFGVPDARGTLLLPELAQEELAEMIGSSRPMVSKLLTEMTARGTLIRSGRRHILLSSEKIGPSAHQRAREETAAAAAPAPERESTPRASARTSRGHRAATSPTATPNL